MRTMEFLLKNKETDREMKNMLMFSIGKIISVFGTAIYTFALGLHVLKITGSALSFASTLVLGLVPMIIISPFAGVIADRFDKKKLVIWMDMLNCLMLAVIYVLSLLYGLNLILIYSATFMLAIFSTFFGVAMEASKPRIVSEEKLMSLNSVSKIIDSLSSISGPMLGGVVFAVLDIRTFIIINSISFAVSAFCEFYTDFKFNYEDDINAEKKNKINFARDIKEGFNYLMKRRNIKSLFVILINLNFFLGFAISVPMPFIINKVLKLSPTEFGIIESFFPMGIIIGALCVKKISENIEYSILLRRLSIILSLCMIATGLPALMNGMLDISHYVYLIYYCMVMISFGMAIALVDIPIAYLMQRLIAEEYRGRVISICVSIAKTMLPVALLLSGTLLNQLPSYSMPLTGGFGLLAINILCIKGVQKNI